MDAPAVMLAQISDAFGLYGVEIAIVLVCLLTETGPAIRRTVL